MIDEIIWVYSTNQSPTDTQLEHLTIQFHVYHYLTELCLLLDLDVSAICQWLFWWTFPRSLELVLLPTYSGRTKISWTKSKSFFCRLTKVSTSYFWLNLSIANKRSTELRTSLRLEMGFSRRHEEFIDILSRVVSLEWFFALIIIREDDVFNPILLFEVSDMETPTLLQTDVCHVFLLFKLNEKYTVKRWSVHLQGNSIQLLEQNEGRGRRWCSNAEPVRTDLKNNIRRKSNNPEEYQVLTNMTSSPVPVKPAPTKGRLICGRLIS